MATRKRHDLARRIVELQGWHIDATSDDPRVSHVELADRANVEPYRVARVIEANRKELEMHGYLGNPDPRSGFPPRRGRGPTPASYMLNEAQAITVLMFLRSEEAVRVRVQVVALFVAFRRGTLTLPPVGAVCIGERDAERREVAMAVAETASALHVSPQRVHGAVRRYFRVSSTLLAPLAWAPQILVYLQKLAIRAFRLPGRGRWRALPAGGAQTTWSWQ